VLLRVNVAAATGDALYNLRLLAGLLVLDEMAEIHEALIAAVGYLVGENFGAVLA
jgi:hypothetical protein